MERRRFFHRCSQLLSGLGAAVLLIPGAGFLSDPLFRARKKKRAHRLLKMSDLQPGVSRKVAINERRTDAWTRYPEGPIGAVWLRRLEDNRVQAFGVTCPHLGCTVNYSAAEDNFTCPCHAARFAGDGRVISGPPQRGLDELAVTIEKFRGEEWVSVVYERFQLGVSEKMPLA